MGGPPAQQQLRIIHLALMFSVVIYGVIAFVVVPQQPAPANPPDPKLIVGAFGVAAVAIMACIPILRSRVRVYMQRSIISWAMSESIALLGLVACFVCHITWPMPVFGAAALGNMVIYRPTSDAK